MKEGIAHIANPALQKRAEPFFQRKADEGKDDGAFFSSIQTKLSVGAKDDPYEKEADAMADKVVKSPATAEQAPVAAAENTVQKKTDAPLNAPSPLQAQVQARFESDSNEEKLQKKEEDGVKEHLQKKPVATDGQDAGTVQRMCRECDEGDKIFRSGEPDVSGMSKRDAVIAMAKTMLGKIKAKQPGGGGQREGADKLWEIFKLAAPGVWQEDDIKTFGKPYPSWCGIFSVWAHKKAGIDLGNWQMGKGVSAFGTLKQTTSPQPGDIGYIDQPNQHHCIITKVNGATIDSIDGNSGLFSEVIENTRPATIYSGFFTAFSGADGGTVSKKDVEGSVQKQADGSAGTAPSSVETSLASSKGGGSGLPAATKTEMESGLGADFSNVKIHTDNRAAQMNKDLNAQAFAHGGDVYFNANKFNPDTSSGKHLLAHELTHTMQQGAAPSVQQKISKKQVQRKDTDSTPIIQKANEPQTPAADPPEAPAPPAKAATADDASKLADPANQKKEKNILDTGKMAVNGSAFELTLKDFPLKEYVTEKQTELKDVRLPLPGTRKTQQGKIWREKMTDSIRESVKKNVLDEGLEDKPELELSLTNTSKEGRDKTKFFGDFNALMAEIVVPFWTIAGAPQIHQIEHKVDWQILGNGKCDEWENFLLLDMGTNFRLGIEVKEDIKARIKKVLDFYRDVLKIDNVTPDPYTARSSYKVVIENFIRSKTKTKSIIEPDKLKVEAGEKNPINRKNITIKEAKRPKGHFIFKTSLTGAGAVLPFNFENAKKNLKFEGKIDEKTDTYELEKITLIRMIRDPKGVATGVTEAIELGKEKEKDNYFKLDQKGYAYSIKNKLKLKDMSQVTLDDDPTLDVHEGVTAKGKVISDISFLKGANIDFGITNSDFFISTTISPGFLNANKKIPKPFSLDYGSITIEANSGDGLKVQGEIGFGIEKLGKGSVKIGIDKTKGFNASGNFMFDKSIFDGSIGFNYENKKWTIKGDAKMNPKNLKGIKSGSVHFEYNEAEETLKIGGDAQLTVPGISQIKIDSTIGKEGDFEVSATLDLEKTPRIKSGRVTVKIGKTKPGAGQPEGASEWDLGIDGTIEPDFKYEGLTINSIKFGYAKGAYDISISAKYKRGKIHADVIEIGVTNKPVSADGKKQEGEPTKDMTFYGELKMSMDIYDGIAGEIDCKLLPDGDITLEGTVKVNEDKQMFSVDPLDKEIFKVEKDIPIASCVVVTLNLFIGGSINLYAKVEPLLIKKDSYVKVGNLSLKKFDDPVITSKIILGSSLIAGAKVSLAVGLSASLLGIIKARIKGVANVNFVAIEAAITGILDMTWDKTTGLEINEASLSLEMASKLIVSFGVTAEILLDLWLTTITLWDHIWPVAEETIPIDIFGEGKKTWKLPLESGGKVGQPKTEDNLKDVSGKATPEEVQSRADDKSKGVSRPKVDKQAEVQQVTQDEVLANFRDPRRFNFDSSENYLETRYGLYDYLKLHSGDDPKIDLNFIDEEIKKAEFEEYDAFTTFIMNDTSFNDDSKSIIIEDFIVNHPTFGETEKVNLRSLIPVKAAPSQKASAKDKGKTVPKKTPEITTPVRPYQGPIQAKAKAGGSKRSGSVTSRTGKAVLKNKSQKNAHKASERNELTEMEEGLFIPDMELLADNDFYNSDPEAAGQDDVTSLSSMNDIENELDNNNEDNHFKPFYMRPYTRTRKPLQQRAEEKSRSPFFSGGEKKEKSNNGAFFQAKLNVGEANDPLEKEADKVADSVTGKGQQKEERKDDIAKGAGVGKPEQEADKAKTPGADKPAAEDKKEKEKTAVQKKEKKEETEEENKTVVNKKDAAVAPATTSAAKGGKVESAIAEKNGRGSSMPANVLQEMQSAIGHDFSDVHIHTDSDAATLSEELDAQAFTTGKDIYFNSGKFDPESESGKHLLAHELTHVVQQNKDTIRRDPKAEKEEKTRAQKVRDDYQKALKAKIVNWGEVATLFNGFNEPEQRQKMAQLSGAQLFQLHQGAINTAGVGPYSSAALMTTPVPDMASAVAAAVETQMIHYQYQEAIDLVVEDLDKRGVINRSLLTAGRMLYLNKTNMRGEGRVLAPGFDQKTGKAKPSDANIGSDAFSPSAGLPLLYSTIIHEFQHVEQMQKPGDSKAEIPDQGNDDQTHVQQEVEAYSIELIRAKESGMYNIPDQVEDTWIRLHSKWQDLADDTRKRKVNDLYKKAHEVAQQALGKTLHLAFTPLKP